MKLQKIILIKLKLLLFLLFCFFYFTGLVQEKLYLKGANDYILVKIISYGEHKIRYKEWPATDYMPVTMAPAIALQAGFKIGILLTNLEKTKINP